ncbi:MAG: COX15/CtaA family protein [Bacteroidota bacterium]
MKTKNTPNIKSESIQKASRLYRRLGTTTVIAVYLLVLAGGIVRSTGSGMGCPDWPKCFGSWVPPTEVSQLPSHYKEDYAQKRKAKNERLSHYLDKLGFHQLGEKIRGDFGGVKEVDFNPTKTWIEYVNRLLGAVVGFLIFLTLLSSIRLIQSDRIVFYVSLLTFVLVGVQGWLGSVVVSTNLLPGTITTHMLLAIAIILLLIYSLTRSYQGIRKENTLVANRPLLNRLIGAAILLSITQVLLGTQVREAVDQAIRLLGYEGRAHWISSLGTAFYIHRSFSLLVFGIHAYLLIQLRKQLPQKSILATYTNALFGGVLLEVLTGVAMAYWSIPAFLQPAHLFLAFVIVGIQFVILLVLNKEAFLLNQTSGNASSARAQALI